MGDSVIARLAGENDTRRLQQLLERCSDSYLLHEGWPTPPDAAVHELTDVPAGHDPSNLLVLGMTDDTGDLVAMIQLLRDCPSANAWWIGLLLVTPELRGRGLGAELLRHATDFIRAQGGQSIGLVVSLRNERALKFWLAAGFRDTERRSQVTARSGHVDIVRILSRELEPR